MTALAAPLSSPRTPPTPSMGVPPAAVALVKRFEGFAKQVKRTTPITAAPYICPAGFWTIGYGHL
ncbi:MAG TPA: hypothetical protein PK129_18350, partial [Cellvibrionaceae bacterium]|nr:hypothetical protein [Cellvibrionaceae bacterium]